MSKLDDNLDDNTDDPGHDRVPRAPLDPEWWVARLGVDLAHGEHCPATAEAARRCGLELLMFRSWGIEEVRALRGAIALLCVESEILGDRATAVQEVLSRHPGGDMDDVPTDDLAAALQVSPVEVYDVLDALAPPWWCALLEWDSAPPSWFRRWA